MARPFSRLHLCTGSAMALAAVSLVLVWPAAAAEAAPADEPAAEAGSGEGTPAPETPAAKPAPAKAEEEARMPAAERPPTPPDAEASEGKQDEPGRTAAKPPKGQKVMRLEDLEDLPLLNRYEIPLEKGKALLADVKDNTFGYDESAFWWLMHLVTKMPAKAFEPGDVTVGYSQLLAMPSAYRGKPVTIRGVYMTCSPFETPVLAIRKDVPTLYECNIREPPLEEERPVATIIVMEDPMAYLHVWDRVKVRGYFYKVRRYQGSKGEGLAPMLVAQRLTPMEGAGDAPTSTIDLGNASVLLVLMICAIVLLGLIYIFLRQKTKATPHAAHQGTGHRIHLRRPDRDRPPEHGGTGGEGGEPKP